MHTLVYGALSSDVFADEFFIFIFVCVVTSLENNLLWLLLYLILVNFFIPVSSWSKYDQTDSTQKKCDSNRSIRPKPSMFRVTR